MRLARTWTVIGPLTVIASCAPGCSGNQFSASSGSEEGGAAGGVASSGGAGGASAGAANAASGGASTTTENDAAGGSAMAAPDVGGAGLPRPDGSAAMHDANPTLPDVAASGDAKNEVGPTIDIPTSGLALWLSADVGVQIVNGRVAGWTDRSGLGRDGAQVVAEYRPVLASAWHGGKPAIFFDGMNRFVTLPSGFADFSQGLTIFAVTEITVDGTCPSYLSFSNGGESDDISVHRQPDNRFEYEVLDQSFASQSNAQPANKASLMTVVHRVEGKVDLYADSALDGEVDMMLPTTTMRVRNEIGRSSYAGCEFLTGNVAEILLYLRPVSEAERIKIEAYLRNKWAL